MKRILFGLTLAVLSSTFTYAQIRVKAVGDVMLGSRTPNPIIPPNNGQIFIDSCAHLLDSADITFANLEGVFVKEGIKPRKCSAASRAAGRCYEFGMPSTLGHVLPELHFNVVSQDNNHASDYGYEGMKFTKTLLDSNNVKCISKKSHVVFEIQDKKVAFVAFGHSSTSNQVFNIANAISVIRDLDKQYDLVFVSFHGGAEGTKARHVYNKTETFYGENRGNLIKFSRAVIDAGADLIIGHGPHVLRGIELYKNKLICYSLGNFLTYGNVNISGVKGHGAIMDLNIDPETGDFINGKIIPTIQVSRGVPVLDSKKGAINDIIELTTADFPESPLSIDKDGNISKK